MWSLVCLPFHRKDLFHRVFEMDAAFVSPVPLVPECSSPVLDGLPWKLQFSVMVSDNNPLPHNNYYSLAYFDLFLLLFFLMHYVHVLYIPLSFQLLHIHLHVCTCGLSLLLPSFLSFSSSKREKRGGCS